MTTSGTETSALQGPEKTEHNKTENDVSKHTSVEVPVANTKSGTEDDQTCTLEEDTQIKSEMQPSLLSLPIDIRFKIYDALIWLPCVIFVTANPNLTQRQRKQTLFTSLLLASKAQKEEVEIWYQKSTRKHKLENMASYYMSKFLPGIWNPITTTVIVERGPYEETDIFLAPQKKNGMELSASARGVGRLRSSGHMYLEVSDDILQRICYEVERGTVRHFCWVFQLKNLVREDS